MKTKTGLWALGVFTIAGAITISCGGSSNSGDDTGTTAGTTSTTGGTTSTTGGTTSSTAGKTTTTGGTTTTTGGTTTTTGGTTTTTGGTGNNNGGRNNNAGGDNGGPGAGGDGGGIPGIPACAAGTANMGMCTRAMGQGATNTCQLPDDTLCTCQRGQQGQNAMSTWRCRMIMINPGAGGDNAGPGQATCPANGKTGDACTNGPGLCAGQRCFCGNNAKLTCL